MSHRMVIQLVQSAEAASWYCTAVTQGNAAGCNIILHYIATCLNIRRGHSHSAITRASLPLLHSSCLRQAASCLAAVLSGFDCLHQPTSCDPCALQDKSVTNLRCIRICQPKGFASHLGVWKAMFHRSGSDNPDILLAVHLLAMMPAGKQKVLNAGLQIPISHSLM